MHGRAAGTWSASARQSTGCGVTEALGGRLAVAREDGEDAHDEPVQLSHVICQEFLGRLVRDLAVADDQIRLELDIRLGRVHLWRVAEPEHAAQVLLRDSGANG